MKKVTLAFPTHDSLWLFKEISKGINVAFAPAKNTITGLFTSEEVSIAVTQFQAVEAPGGTPVLLNSVKELESGRMVSFRNRLLQGLALTLQPAYKFYRALF